MRDKLSSFTHKWKTRCSKKAKSLVLSSTFFVQKHSCLVFIFTTSSSRLDTSVEATNKGIWAQAEIEPYNLICCWDLLSTLGKSTFFQDIQKLALKKDFAAVCFLFLFFVYVFHLFTFLIVCLRFWLFVYVFQLFVYVFLLFVWFFQLFVFKVTFLQKLWVLRFYLTWDSNLGPKKVYVSNFGIFAHCALA